MPSLKLAKPPINGRKPVEPVAPPPPELLSAPVQRCLEEDTLHWHKTLQNRTVMHNHLLTLGLTHAAVEELGIGFSDGRLGELVPPSSEEHRARRELMFACGILDGHGRERFAGCLVFPVRDMAGLIVNVYGITPDGSREVFLPYPCPLYNVRALIAGEVTVTRSIFDFLSRYGKGDRAVLFAHAGLTDTDIEAALTAGRHVMPDDKNTETGSDVEIITKGETLFIHREARRYRIDGFFRNRYTASLPITLELRIPESERPHVDRMDLYESTDRDKFARRAAKKFSLTESVIEEDLDALLTRLREMQDELVLKKLESGPEKVELSESERAEAEEFLRTKPLIKRIIADFKTCGTVGEEMNLLANYLIAVSRLLDKPLHALYQSSSASGKSTLMKAVLAFMPEEIVFLITSMSRQSLYYMDHVLHGMILALEEDAGKDLIGYPLKTLMSEGHATFMAPVKDEKTGELRTKKTHVSGAPTVWTTSTAHTLNEEEQNRNVILAPDESPEQTRRILEGMRFKETAAGQKRGREAAKIRGLHRNAQRCLRSLNVRIPDELKLPVPGARQRYRRDYPKYVGFIKACALLHQYQRTIVTEDTGETVIAQAEDLAVADMIADAVLGHSTDECPPHTRNFLGQIFELAEETARGRKTTRLEVYLSARAMADFAGLSVWQVNRHLARLFELELVDYREKTKSRLREYVILWNGAQPHGHFFPPDNVENTPTSGGDCA